MTDITTDPADRRHLTIRDQFAMAALTGMIIWDDQDEMTYEIIARCAYIHADAMLKEREKPAD